MVIWKRGVGIRVFFFIPKRLGRDLSQTGKVRGLYINGAPLFPPTTKLAGYLHRVLYFRLKILLILTYLPYLWVLQSETPKDEEKIISEIFMGPPGDLLRLIYFLSNMLRQVACVS